MKKAKIIVLSGQSNAVGVGHTKYLNKSFTDEKIKEYYHYIPNDYEITSKVYVVPSIMPISIPSAIPYMVPIY